MPSKLAKIDLMPGFQITAKARSDLEEIWLYSARQWGPDQADIYQDKLDNAFQRIADGIILSHSCSQYVSDASDELRYSIVERHYVIFCASENVQDSIDILTIIHQASSDQMRDYLLGTNEGSA